MSTAPHHSSSPTPAQLIDGKATAEALRAQIKQDVASLTAQHNIIPGLAVVLVGEDPASQVYVRNKAKQTEEVGMKSVEIRLPATTSQAELLAQVDALNIREDIHGILVQLPLPKHIEENAVINRIAPEKDVDGFHVINSGKLATGQKSMVPCTPLGCLMLIKQVQPSLSGLHAVVIGRSNIVGKPMASLLLEEHCTVTIVHSKTKQIEAICQQADILVAAVGRPEIVSKNWVKPGAIVIDVGINRILLADGKTKLVGDVNFAEVSQIARAITPVPGGVGPMTIACLLRNTLVACCTQHQLAHLDFLSQY